VIARTVTYRDGTPGLIIDHEIPDDAPAEIREGLARRTVVNSGDPCPCGAQLILPNRSARRRALRTGTVLHIEVEHEDDCPAHSAVARLAAWRGGLR
jgi:hypothetical protein